MNWFVSEYCDVLCFVYNTLDRYGGYICIKIQN